MTDQHRKTADNTKNEPTRNEKGTAMIAEPKKRDVAHIRTTTSLIAIMALMAATVPAQTAIVNDATANGTPARSGGTFTPPTDSETVPVAPGSSSLSIVKSVLGVTVTNGADASNIDGTDVITYYYVITNTGTETLTDVEPVDTGPTFNGELAGASLSSFTHQPTDPSNTSGVTPASVGPGQSVVFTATYTLTTEDWLYGSQVDDGVDNSATATANETLDTPVTPSDVEYNIPPNPNLQIVKSFAFTTDGGTASQADVNDVIEYTYTVTNIGNVAMNDVSITDVHEPLQAHEITLVSDASWNESLSSDGPLSATDASTDAATDGSWDVLQPGAVITFTYSHTVTQAEFDAQ